MVTIYGFLEGPASAGGWEVTATCECGDLLLQYRIDRAEDARYTLGVTSDEQHQHYREHCAEKHEGNAFQIEWVDDPSNYQGLRQSDVEVMDWTEEELASLASKLLEAFPVDQDNLPASPEKKP